MSAMSDAIQRQAFAWRRVSRASLMFSVLTHASRGSHADRDFTLRAVQHPPFCTAGRTVQSLNDWRFNLERLVQLRLSLPAVSCSGGFGATDVRDVHDLRCSFGFERVKFKTI